MISTLIKSHTKHTKTVTSIAPLNFNKNCLNLFFFFFLTTVNSIMLITYLIFFFFFFLGHPTSFPNHHAKHKNP